MERGARAATLNVERAGARCLLAAHRTNQTARNGRAGHICFGASLLYGQRSTRISPRSAHERAYIVVQELRVGGITCRASRMSPQRGNGFECDARNEVLLVLRVCNRK